MSSIGMTQEELEQVRQELSEGKSPEPVSPASAPTVYFGMTGQELEDIRAEMECGEVNDPFAMPAGRNRIQKQPEPTVQEEQTAQEQQTAQPAQTPPAIPPTTQHVPNYHPISGRIPIPRKRISEESDYYSLKKIVKENFNKYNINKDYKKHFFELYENILGEYMLDNVFNKNSNSSIIGGRIAQSAIEGLLIGMGGNYAIIPSLGRIGRKKDGDSEYFRTNPR